MKYVCACAQGTELRNFTFYSQKEGLSNYNIHKIIQDDKKFLWIATQDGLNRFDGTSFTEYNKGLEARRALLSNDIRDLLYDTAHEIIWVICNQGGINGVDVLTGNVIFSVLYNNKILEADWRTCAVMLNKNIFIGSSGGVEVFNIPTHTFGKRQVLETSFPLGCFSIDVHAMATDKYQNIWIAIENKGVLIYNPASDAILQVIHPEALKHESNTPTFWPLYEAFDSGNICWIGATNKLLAIRFDSAYHTHLISLRNKSVSSIATQTINHLAVNKDGDLLISGDALFRYNITQNKLLRVMPADQENNKWLTDITYCYEDLQKNLWLGCKQGLGQMKNNKLAFSPTHNSRAFNDALSHVYSICALDSERLLAGTKEGLFIVNNKQQKSRRLQKGLIQNIFRLKENEIIISGDRGVQLWKNNCIVAVKKHYPEFATYSTIQLNSCAKLSDSIIVLGTESNDGILVWNIKRHLVMNIRQADKYGLLSNIVNTVFVSSDKHIFVLSDYGITLINGNNFNIQKLTWKNPVSKVPVGIFMDMTETAGYYWINTYSEGLVMMDKSFRIVKTFGVKDGISNAGLYKLFNYKDSILIATSNNGITVFDIKTNACRQYYDEDGLQNNTFEEACGDIYNNIFYAGGVEGYVAIYPDNLTTDNIIPDLYFTRLKIKGDKQKLTDTFNLNFRSYSIPPSTLQTDVYFSGIDYNHPTRIRYTYRIREKEKEWIYLNAQNFIPLIGLTTGTYTLQVRVSSQNGLWSKPKEIQLIYLPKWYETIWFDMLSGICIVSILYSFYKYRINQIKQHQLIRKNIANDLHDDLGSTLNTMKVFTHLAQKNNNNHYYLQQIETSVTEAIIGLRDMIWVLDDSQDSVQALLARTENFASPIASASNINFECLSELSDTEQDLTKTEKRNLLMIIKETINNSIKYAECKSIRVVFRQGNNKWIVEIADDGKGFDSKKIVRGNGLANLQYRAEQIKCLIEILSSPGKGTIVKIEKNKK